MDLGPLPKLHPRTSVVDSARLEFDQFFLDLEQKHNLTYGEMYHILAVQLLNLTKYHIRCERHPDDPEKKGDEA